jgi:poly(3-hydroxybutyrate) depolymerase
MGYAFERLADERGFSVVYPNGQNGLSESGYMAIRLALEAPGRFRAVAPVAANLSVPENFQCKPVTQGSASVILIHGTMDPLVPYDGTEGSLFRAVNREQWRWFAAAKIMIAWIRINPTTRSAASTRETSNSHAGFAA